MRPKRAALPCGRRNEGGSAAAGSSLAFTWLKAVLILQGENLFLQPVDSLILQA